MKHVMVVLLLVSSMFAKEIKSDIKKLSTEIGSSKRLATLHFKRADLYSQNGSYKKALKDYKIVRVYNPDYKDIQFRIAKTYVDVGMPYSAIGLIDKLSLNDSNPKEYQRYLLLQAKAYLLLKKYKTVINIFEKKVLKNKLRPVDYVRFADAYYLMGDIRKSMNVLKSALGKDKSNYTIAKKLLQISIEEGSYTLANSMIDIMFKHKSLLSETYYLQAQLHASKYDIDKAIECNVKAYQSLIKLSNLEQNTQMNKLLKNDIKQFEKKLSTYMLTLN